MSMFKTLLYSFLFGIATINPLTAATPSHEATIAAVVNEGNILKSELRDRVRLVMISGQLENTPEVYRQLEQQLLKTMIDELLQIQLAEKFDIKITEEETEEEFAILEERNGMRKGDLIKFLAHHRIPKSILVQQIKASFLWRQYVQKRYQPLVQISNSEVQNVVRRKENVKGQKQVLLAEIVLSFDSEQEAGDAQKQATRLLQQLKKGAQFPMIAHQFSKSASAARGGDIGWVSMNQLDANLQQGLEALSPGELSATIRNGKNYHILLLRDQREAGQSTEKIVNFLKIFVPWPTNSTMEQKEQLFQRVQTISKTAKSLSILQNLIKSLPGVDAKMMPNTRMSSLHPELKEILEKLPIGKPSEAIGTPMGVFLFVVEDIKEIQSDTEEQIYQDLAERKLMSLAQREMRNLRREAFIDIRA